MPTRTVQLELEQRTVSATIEKQYYLPSTGTLLVCDIEGYGHAEFVRLNNGRPDERRTRSGMPASYTYKKSKDIKWEYYPEDTADAKKVCRLFVQGYEQWRKQGRGLYIWSGVKGSGKTLLACALANEVIDKYSAVVKFVNAADFVKMVSSKDENGLKPLYDCGLLVFDDIGSEDRKKEWITESIYRLVNHRYSNCLPTVYTSNNPFTKTHADGRIHDRIFGASVEVKLPEANIRQAIALRSQETFLKELEENYG